jgi:hypothetical protein
MLDTPRRLLTAVGPRERSLSPVRYPRWTIPRHRSRTRARGGTACVEEAQDFDYPTRWYSRGNNMVT